VHAQPTFWVLCESVGDDTSTRPSPNDNIVIALVYFYIIYDGRTLRSRHWIILRCQKGKQQQ